MKNAPSAESLFNTLKAENEPWLGDVFVSLPVFERLREERSTILYGDAGSGKTTLRLMLTKHLGEETFTALWTPEPTEDSVEGTSLARQAMKQALRACIERLILEGNLPQRLGEPSVLISSALQWFLRNCLPFNAEFYIQSQSTSLSQDALQWYLKLLERTFPSVVTEQMGLKDQVQLLFMVLQAAKYKRLWLMIDGLERWTPRQMDRPVGAALEATLSTLVFFDNAPSITFKFFIPASLKSLLHKTSGVERHRAIETDLTWSAEELKIMLEKRLASALSPKKASLDALCENRDFLEWLKEYGGTSPRAWQQLTAPLLAEAQRLGTRLSAAQSREFVRQRPAPLRLDSERREVWIGRKLIPFNSAPEFRILEYLAARPGKIGSLEAVYYYAQEKLERIPDKGEAEWVAPKTLRKRIDTLLWRVRKKIELNPDKPIYLVTRRGQGLELLHTEV